MQYFGKTDTGIVRANNEDAFLVAPPVFAVADGMGGHAAGEIASKIVVDTLEKKFCELKRLSVAVALKQLIELANREILLHGWNNIQHAGLGTTITALVVQGDNATWAHCGDSRLYLMRDGELAQQTSDHSLVEQMVREGLISKAEAKGHPKRNMLTNALGADSSVEVDIGAFAVRSGDVVLICSDGLYNMISDEDIAQVISQREKSIDIRGCELIDLAKLNGGTDNITVVLLEC